VRCDAGGVMCALAACLFVTEHDVEFCLYLFAVEGLFKSFGDLIAGICCSRGCNSG